MLLDALGLNADEESLYQVLITRQAWTLDDMRRETGISSTKATQVTHLLESKGLVTRGIEKPPLFYPSAPRVAIESLISQRQSELEETRGVATRLQATFRAALAASPQEQIEITIGPEAIAGRFNEFQQFAQTEVVAFDTPPYVNEVTWAPNPVELAALGRGVRYRVVYDQRALGFAGQIANISALSAAGERTRVFQDVPTKMAIADKALALIPTSLDDPIGGLLVIRSPALVTLLSVLFEYVWAASVPIDLRAGGSPPSARAQNAEELSHEEQFILRLLAAGLKDGAIARQLGLAKRTYDRRIEGIMRSLGAQTRFQAGLLATQKALIGEGDVP